MAKFNLVRLGSIIVFIFIELLSIWNISYANDLMIRNPYQAKANIQSTHFAYWYNDTDPEINIQKLQRHLDIIETIKERFVDVQGYKDPITEYKMNIYMEDAGGSVPVGEIASVFVGNDPDGYQFIHMSKKKLRDSDQLIRALLAHELFHTIQFLYFDVTKMTTAPFDYFWFQEGSASWASYSAWDDIELLKYWGLWALIVRPELRLTYSNYDNYADSSAQRMYSTSFFLWWVSKFYADDQLIKNILLSYENIENAGLSYLPPLSVLTQVVDKIYGHDLEKIFADFTAHSVLLDYPKRQEFLEWLSDSDVNLDQSLSMEHQELTTEWQQINHHNWQGERGPAQSWGSSYIKLSSSNIGEFELSFKGLLKGALASKARWRLTLVTSTSDDIQYQAITLDENFEVIAQLIDTRNVDAVYLSVTAFSDVILANEQFDFAYQLAPKGGSTLYKPVDWTPIIDKPKKSSGGTIFWLLIIMSVFCGQVFKRRKLRDSYND
jgi:hypothetical protein